MPFVVDASVTLGWCLPDEANAYTAAVLARLTADQAVVPAVWRLEVSNALLVAVRRGRVTQAQTLQSLALLDSLPIGIDLATTDPDGVKLVDLARNHGLTVYDATYLELAMRSGYALATQDRRLQSAMTAVGVALLT